MVRLCVAGATCGNITLITSRRSALTVLLSFASKSNLTMTRRSFEEYLLAVLIIPDLEI